MGAGSLLLLRLVSAPLQDAFHEVKLITELLFFLGSLLLNWEAQLKEHTLCRMVDMLRRP